VLEQGCSVKKVSGARAFENQRYGDDFRSSMVNFRGLHLNKKRGRLGDNVSRILSGSSVCVGGTPLRYSETEASYCILALSDKVGRKNLSELGSRFSFSLKPAPAQIMHHKNLESV
jgi:hypothetical protein